MITADLREDNYIINKLKSSGIEIKVDLLEVGDYLLPDGVIIERKEDDFIDSILNGRLWQQLNNLSQSENAILCIVTENLWRDMYFSKSQNIHKSVFGALSTIAYKYKIPVITFENKDDFISFLISLHNKIINTKPSSRPVPILRKPKNDDEIIENILAQIPGISVGKAKLILSHFNSLEKLAAASIEELKSIKGIGEKLAKRIKYYFEYEYRNTR